MPLFNRKPFSLLEPPKDLDSKEKVFQIRFTKEIFRDYQYPFCMTLLHAKLLKSVQKHRCKLNARFLCLLHLQKNNLAMPIRMLVSLTTHQRISKEAKPLSPKSLDM